METWKPIQKTYFDCSKELETWHINIMRYIMLQVDPPHLEPLPWIQRIYMIHFGRSSANIYFWNINNTVMIRGGQKGFEVWIGLIEHARTIHDAHISAPMCLFLSADKGQGTWHGGLPAFLSFGSLPNHTSGHAALEHAGGWRVAE